MGRKLSLINPKDGPFLMQYVDGVIERQFHLMTDWPNIVALNVNRFYHGRYLIPSPLDESFLRNHRQMPGMSYCGGPSVRSGASDTFTSNAYIPYFAGRLW